MGSKKNEERRKNEALKKQQKLEKLEKWGPKALIRGLVKQVGTLGLSLDIHLHTCLAVFKYLVKFFTNSRGQYGTFHD